MREVHHDRVIDKVVVLGSVKSVGFGEQIWDHTFYIEEWGEHLIAVNDYTNKGRAKVYNEQTFNVFQSYCPSTREIGYYYYPKNGGAARRLQYMSHLLDHAPWENPTVKKP